LDCPDGELSILIVDDAQISELNEQYLGRHGPTNVLAFPMDSEPPPDTAPHLLGDVVISAETAEGEADMAGIGRQQRLIQLLIHGILHLFRYDHEGTAADAATMERKSLELDRLVHR